MKKKPTSISNGFDEWGVYMEAKKRKLEEQFKIEANADTNRGGIFQEVAIFVNGYTIPSAEELKALMLLHGGIYHHYESSRTTHIIASNLPHTKIKNLKGGERIIKPEWIVDSIASGKLLDYKKYLLVTDTSSLSKLLKRSNFTSTDESCFKSSPEMSSCVSNQVFDARSSSDELKFGGKKIDTTSTSKLQRRSMHTSESLIGSTIHSIDPQVTSTNYSIDPQVTSTNYSMDPQVTSTNYSTDPQVTSTNHSMNPQVTSTNISLSQSKTSKNTNPLNPQEKGTNNVPLKSLETGANNPLIPEETKTCLKAVNISVPTSAKTASNEDFLGEFYSNSRLHHLSTMGAMFKQYVNELREKHDGQFRGRNALLDWKSSQGISENEELDETFSDNPSSSDPEPVIMHIDMDCFFVSVGTRHQPELRDEPVAVAHGKGNSNKIREGVNRQAEFDIYRQRTMNRMGLSSENHTRFNKVNSIGELDSMSEIASCNYKARDCGLKNGMFVGQALKKCPKLKIVPYDFEGYKEVSYCLYNLIASLTLNIEAVSCDEMYVDCSQLVQELCLLPLQFASYLRETISRETGCTCSTGFGSNRLQARLATKKAKPNGQFQLTSETTPQFMLSIPLSELPGVGHALLYKLNALGAQTCGDLQKISLKTLQNELGNKNGLTLHNHCRGQDDKELTFEHQRKSVSAEVNYGIRFQNNQEMETFIKQLAGEVEKRLDEIKMKGKCITLKLMVRSAEAPREASKFLGHGVCDYITKSISLPVYISQASQIFKEVMSIVNKLKIDSMELRGVGIQVSKLELMSKTLPTIETFFTNKTKPPEPSTSPGKKLIFVPNLDLVKSPKRRQVRSPRKKSPKKVGGIKLYLMKKAQATPQVPEDFDRSVFEALPDDIKIEVLRSTEEQRSLLKSPRGMPDNLDESFLGALPEDIRQEVIEDVYRQQNITRRDQEKSPTKPLAQHIIFPESSVLDRPSPCPILDASASFLDTSHVLGSSVSLEEMRTMLREWLREEAPESSDIEMFSDYLINLVKERNLSHIVILLRFLQRYVNKRESIVWSEAYNGILSCVQSAMVEKYGHELRI